MLHGAFVLHAGLTPKERDNLTEKVSALYNDGFTLNFDLFSQIVCPNDQESPHLGEILLEVQFLAHNDGLQELVITLKKAINVLAMDDGDISDPYAVIKVGDEHQKSTVKPKARTHAHLQARAHRCTRARAPRTKARHGTARNSIALHGSAQHVRHARTQARTHAQTNASTHAWTYTHARTAFRPWSQSGTRASRSPLRRVT